MVDIEKLQYERDRELFGREMAERLKISGQFATKHERLAEAFYTIELAARVERSRQSLGRLALLEEDN